MKNLNFKLKPPKSIFISGFSSAPLSADLDFISKGYEDKIQIAINFLSKL